MLGAAVASAPPAIVTPSRRETVALRLDQTGYNPHDDKVAVAMSQQNLAGQTFKVVNSEGQVILDGQVGQDRGAYGQFDHVYALDFSSLQQSGQYRIVLGKQTSPQFAVRDRVDDQLLGPTLDFYKVQRCGTTDATLHGPCHDKDGVAVGGPQNGQPVAVDGGWHDAGDYLKFMVTTGVTDILMLTAYQRHPEAFPSAGPNATPQVLQEARVGLEWMARMWDPQHQVLYYQVGDESDHETWRLPDGDDQATGARKVWACEPGKGANLAGKSAASLALASVLWNDSSRPCYDPKQAAQWLTTAKELYEWGKAHPAAQSTNPTDFYTATGWQDDMALAAAELYRATGQDRYRQEAEAYAHDAGGATFDVDHVHALAHYEIARLDPGYKSTAVALLDADLKPLQQHAQSDPFHSALSNYTWGSVELLTGTALEAQWYDDLTSTDKYRQMAQQQRDYILGVNPWGVSMVSGAGSTWVHHPHHQIADLTHTDIPGIWAQGPCNAKDWKAQNIEMGGPDIYAPYQTDDALFHDDVADYVTTEPTINTNALGLAMTAWDVAGSR